MTALRQDTRRRWRQALVLVALVVLAAVGVAMAGSRANLSQAVYPPASSSVRFTHRSHAAITCARCHPKVASSVSPSDRNLPAEAACRECHNQTRKSDAEKQSSAPGCAFCHTGYKGKGSPARPRYPAANLRFNHRLHMQRGATCAGCHGAAADPKLPSMKTCRACHAKKKKSLLRCVVCHKANKDGRLITRYPTGKLVPRGTLQGDVHGPLFTRKHGGVARGKRKYCESCHQPKDCLKCHAGSLRPMSIHSGDYTRRHALDARRNQPRCSSCHRSQSFCLGCHQRMGVGAETRGSGFKPHTTARFHSKAFTGITKGPGHHAHAARRNIRTCSSCHREATCVRCHGTRARGRGGFSPHGAGWRGSAKCRALAARNHRACLKCHRAGDRKIACQ